MESVQHFARRMHLLKNKWIVALLCVYVHAAACKGGSRDRYKTI